MIDGQHDDRLAERFERQRARLRSIALRITGTETDAEDAVQETWIRLSRADADSIDNLDGWLTTVVSRLSIDLLRSRASRRVDDAAGDGLGDRTSLTLGPEDEAVLDDAVGRALLVVLDSLSPSERLAFVLHDVFAVPFDEIATILGRSPAAAKQLASRARRRVRGTDVDAPISDGLNVPVADVERHQEIVQAFLAASRAGEFDRLVALLHPDVALYADGGGLSMGSPASTTGADAVATTFSGRAKGAQAAVLDGSIGFVWMLGGGPKVAWEVTIIDDQIVRIDMIGDETTLAEIDLDLLDA